MSKFIRFLKSVAIKTTRNIKNFIIGSIKYAETTATLILSAVGLNFILSEMPFIFMLPAWVELPMFIPAISVLMIIGLLKLAEHRHHRQITANV